MIDLKITKQKLANRSFASFCFTIQRQFGIGENPAGWTLTA
jgi:hypothetical protein